MKFWAIVRRAPEPELGDDGADARRVVEARSAFRPIQPNADLSPGRVVGG